MSEEHNNRENPVSKKPVTSSLVAADSHTVMPSRGISLSLSLSRFRTGCRRVAALWCDLEMQFILQFLLREHPVELDGGCISRGLHDGALTAAHYNSTGTTDEGRGADRRGTRREGRAIARGASGGGFCAQERTTSKAQHR